MPQAAFGAGSFTYADYCLCPEDGCWELIDGEVFAMKPAPTRLHQETDPCRRNRWLGDPLAGSRNGSDDEYGVLTGG